MSNSKSLSCVSILIMLVSVGLMNGLPVHALDIDRSVLPIRHPDQAPITEMDARNATKPEPFKVEAPEGAPNVVSRFD